MNYDNVKRTRANRVSIYLDDRELRRLNRMVDRTHLNREQFLRRLIEGATIVEAPPAPLWQTVSLMRQAAEDLRDIAENSYLTDVSDEDLLRKTMDNLNACVSEIRQRCLVEEKKLPQNVSAHRAARDWER